jgi:probable phosphoglycerate mutase
VPGSSVGDDPELHEVGHEQARALGLRMASLPVTAVYTSDFERAYRTGVYVADHHGLEVIVDPDLREVDLGDWRNGEYRRRAAARDPEFLTHIASGRWDDVPGGEGDDALRHRMRGAVERVVAAHLTGDVVIVCHSGIINAWFADQLGLHPSRLSHIENTSVSTIAVGLGRYSIQSVNDTRHLPDPLLA